MTELSDIIQDKKMKRFYKLEKLAGSNNYNKWSSVIRHVMEEEGIWNCITGEVTNRKQDRLALAIICLHIQPQCLSYVRNAASSKIAWKNLRKAFLNRNMAYHLTQLFEEGNLSWEDFLQPFSTTLELS